MSRIFTYKNPVYSPAIDSIRDCQILEDGGRYYLIGTCPPYWEGPNPGIKLYSSDDLLNWRFERLLLDREAQPADVWYRDRFWAPELHKIGGLYYLLFSARNHETKFQLSCGLAVAQDILGPYKVLTHDKPLVPNAIDLSFYVDEDQRVYAYWAWGHIYGQEIDLKTCSLLGAPARLLEKEPGKWDGIGIEGSFVLKRNGRYFMFYSSWTRGYEIGYATAPAPLGPWTKSAQNPFFGAQNKAACEKNHIAFTGDPDGSYVGLGHNAVFTGPDGRDWLVCHYQEKDKPESLGFDPIWFEGGEVRSNGPTNTVQEVPCP